MMLPADSLEKNLDQDRHLIPYLTQTNRKVSKIYAEKPLANCLEICNTQTFEMILLFNILH